MSGNFACGIARMISPFAIARVANAPLPCGESWILNDCTNLRTHSLFILVLANVLHKFEFIAAFGVQQNSIASVIGFE